MQGRCDIMDKKEARFELTDEVLELNALLEKAKSVSKALHSSYFQEEWGNHNEIIKEFNDAGYLASITVECIEKAIAYLDENF